MAAQTSESLASLEPGQAWAAAMAQGDFAAAWQASDAVLARRDKAARDDPGQPYHLRWVWDGRPFDGKDVLVRCYHGLGDTIQFSRFLPALRRRARHLTLEVQENLFPLLHGWADLVVPFRPEAPAPCAEVDLEIMELCHALRLAPEPEPYLRTVPYLRAVPATQRRPRLQLGLCWQVNSTWQPERSVPPELLAAVTGIEGVECHSLQLGAGDPLGLGKSPAAIAETAAVIAGLDLVITIDTMVAHLAGALGIPVWLLLLAEPDWRWRAGGQGSPWYRGVTKFSQSRPGDWEAPVAALVAALTRATADGTLAPSPGL